MKIFTKNNFNRIFDSSSIHWTADVMQNLIFLRSCEYRANEELLLKGYVTINEIYDMIGLEKVDKGDHIGWVFYPDSEDKILCNSGLYKERICFDIHSSSCLNNPNVSLSFNIDSAWAGDISSLEKRGR